MPPLARPIRRPGSPCLPAGSAPRGARRPRRPSGRARRIDHDPGPPRLSGKNGRGRSTCSSVSRDRSPVRVPSQSPKQITTLASIGPRSQPSARHSVRCLDKPSHGRDRHEQARFIGGQRQRPTARTQRSAPLDSRLVATSRHVEHGNRHGELLRRSGPSLGRDRLAVARERVARLVGRRRSASARCCARPPHRRQVLRRARELIATETRARTGSRSRAGAAPCADAMTRNPPFRGRRPVAGSGRVCLAQEACRCFLPLSPASSAMADAFSVRLAPASPRSTR